jgi:alpha-mannosidase
MLETLRRVRDLQGVPRTAIVSSDEFFDALEADAKELPTILGELYFEFHRGTYTTQGAVKRGNREGERALHDADLLAGLAARAGAGEHPSQRLAELWQLLLLNQFHDILPGSSIALVYEDAARDHDEIRSGADAIADAALAALGQDEGGPTPFNTIAFARSELAPAPGGELVWVEAPPYGYGAVAGPPGAVTVVEHDDAVVLENGVVRAELGRDGRLRSLVELASGREALAGPGNVLQVYDDHPTAHDAWDVDPFHLETVADCPPATACEVAARGPLRAEVAFERSVGRSSSMRQVVRLDAGARRLEFHCEADWRESNTMLKVLFRVGVRSGNATYQMQFGHTERPTHYSTSHDLARFEVPGHRFADLSEHGFGVALLTDCKYGYSTYGNEMRISLLRSPKVPDAEADMGRHAFAYAVMPHAGGWRDAGVVGEAARFETPLRWAPGAAEPGSLFSVDDPNLVLDTVKRAEDSDALVLRLYDAHGARGTARVRIGVPFTSAVACNLLEDPGEPLEADGDEVVVPYRPHEIVSVLVR